MHRQARQTLVKIGSFIVVIILLILIKGMFNEDRQGREKYRKEIRENAVIHQLEQQSVCDADINKSTRPHIYQNSTKLFFNRIPKTGSGITRIMFDKMADKNDFRYAGASGRPDISGSGMNPPEAELKRRVFSHLENAANENEKIVIIGHIWFVNFTKYGYQQPIYINLVRDPVDRLVSWYNFIRFAHPRNMSDERRAMTYDTCVTSYDEECFASKNIASMVPFFCGQEAFCSQPGLQSLQTAKLNIMRHYSVVGYMDKLDEFFMALELLHPNFFHNIYDTFQGFKSKLKETRTQSNKTVASKEVREIMMSRIPEEYELYQFIKQRFDCLLKIHNIDSSIK